MQQNHCGGVLSNDWNTLLGQQISQHTAMSMSRSALVFLGFELSSSTFFRNGVYKLLRFFSRVPCLYRYRS